MLKVNAIVIADSLNPHGNRLLSMSITAPRCVLAEINTHRTFSRNSASSRAIPTRIFREMVERNPYLPEQVLAAQKGMTAAGPLSSKDQAAALNIIECLRINCIEAHIELEQLNVSKQQANRYLEPFLYTTILVSSTEWENFFTLRSHEATDPALQAVSDCMLKVYASSVPEPRDWGEWHLPYANKGSNVRCPGKDVLMTCAMRCARVSFARVHGSDDVARATDLAHDGHYSPFEHVAQAEVPLMPSFDSRLVVKNAGYRNYDGWRQLRHDIEQTYPRPPISMKALLAKRQEVSPYAR